EPGWRGGSRARAAAPRRDGQRARRRASSGEGSAWLALESEVGKGDSLRSFSRTPRPRPTLYSVGMSDADLFATLTGTHARLVRRELSPVELVRAQLARIDGRNPSLHAYLVVLAESALEEARAAEKELAAGRVRGPLHGVPIGVKDLCDVAGVVTTSASKVLDPVPAARDSGVVRKLRAAGAVIVGKLHQTEFALSGYHPSLPVPVNPWDPTRFAGVSSSGSGVAAAAGLAFATIGTDTGGSI